MAGYVRAGRGGAGNFVSREEAMKKEETLAKEEASQQQQRSRESSVEPPTGDATEYKHMGRGGAGNWYAPAELALNGTTDSTPTDSGLSTPEPASQRPQSIRPWKGRGGAGNYAWDTVEKESEVEKQDEERAKRVEEEVRKNVEAELTKPGMAHVHMRAGGGGNDM